jgi:hypothetical protein
MVISKWGWKPKKKGPMVPTLSSYEDFKMFIQLFSTTPRSKMVTNSVKNYFFSKAHEIRS